jgi:hypothetical protein
MDIVLVILGGVALVFQLVAAYLAFKIYKFNRLSGWWLILLSAFELEALRRFILVIQDIQLSYVPPSLMLDRTILFAVSLFLNIGLLSMLHSFQSFDFLEKKVSEKAKKLKK